MKTIIVRFVFLPLIFYGLPLVAQRIHPIWAPPYENGIAAVVEEKIITFEELRREMSPLISQIQGESRSEGEFSNKMSQLYLEILQNLIDHVLIVNAFRKKELAIPQSIIENELDRMLIEDFNNDRHTFLEHVKSQGKTMREFRKDLEERIIVSSMRAEMRKSQSEVSPEKIEGFYKENKILFYIEESLNLRLIMLKPFADESPDLLRQTAENIIVELENGENFTDLAARYSQDSRRDRGGDWGWIKRVDLREELSEVAFELNPREHSDPILLGNQIFILYVENIKDETIQPLSQVRDNIEGIIVNQIARYARKVWIERLRRDAYVKYF